MKRALIFAERNVKEILRSPASWMFGLALPIGLFAVMQIIIKSIGEEAAAAVPMFGVARFTGGALLFGASFLSVFCAILISSDRSKSFLVRLYVSPMRAHEYIIGYMLSVVPVAAVQNAVTFVAALCFGLTPTWNILPAVAFSLLSSVLFISVGVIAGSVLGEKNAGPLCSMFVQVAALLSGMWFDLDMIGGGFSVFCHVLPFAHIYDITRYTLAGNYGELWLPMLVVAAYIVGFTVLAVALFRRSSKVR